MTNPNMETLLVAGIDIGSSAVKVAVMEDRGEKGADLLFGRGERIRKRDPHQVAADLFEHALSEASVRRDRLAYVATTGEGEGVPFRTGHFYGMTTHARGGRWMDPEAEAVLDVGGLHARAVKMDEKAKVLGYRMTSQCASGSGQFLENISRYLGITIDEIGPLSLQAQNPEQCSSICAVLAETDVINMVSRGIPTPDIIKGIHQSMAGRYLRLLNSIGIKKVALVTGGLAADVGLLQAIREAGESQGLKLEIRSHEHSMLAGAIGAALWGGYRARKLAAKGIGLGLGGAGA